jgi:hypothetical protein
LFIPVIPATQEEKIWRIQFEVSPDKKVSSVISVSKLGTVTMSAIPAMQEGHDHGLRLTWGKKCKTLSEK